MLQGRRLRVLAAAVYLPAAGLVVVAKGQTPRTEPDLTEEQQREFLLHAKTVNSKQIGKGVTSPWRLTPSDGTLTHDAALQAVDERKNRVQFMGGPREIGFRDSYHYNIAAYELSKLPGLSDMVPVTVERQGQCHGDALSGWIPWKWDEGMHAATLAASQPAGPAPTTTTSYFSVTTESLDWILALTAISSFTSSGFGASRSMPDSLPGSRAGRTRNGLGMKSLSAEVGFPSGIGSLAPLGAKLVSQDQSGLGDQKGYAPLFSCMPVAGLALHGRALPAAYCRLPSAYCSSPAGNSCGAAGPGNVGRAKAPRRRLDGEVLPAADQNFPEGRSETPGCWAHAMDG